MAGQPRPCIPQVFAAAEGSVVELVGAIGDRAPTVGDPFSAFTVTSPRLAEHLVLLGVEDPVQSQFLTGIVNAEGIRVRHETDDQMIIQAVLSDRPTLLVLEHNPPKVDGLALCRKIRLIGDKHAADMPIAIVSAQEDAVGGMASGVTAWLMTPFSSIYARTRLRAGLFRLREF